MTGTAAEITPVRSVDGKEVLPPPPIPEYVHPGIDPGGLYDGGRVGPPEPR